ncbi:hypothetical protein V1514DRAFT_133025 [Lipomyces japonicus]|uniref:uncharacterized protein n=1 Tax=Lipomyces japonicus TaxID=56871 RepID=UPI0034CECCC5
MLLFHFGVFILSLSFCVVSICAARHSFFADDHGDAQPATAAAAAAAAAGLTTSSSLSSPLSLSYASIFAFPAAFWYSASSHKNSNEDTFGQPLASPACCSSSWRRRRWLDPYLSCPCSSPDDEQISIPLEKRRSTCSIGDDFMSCRAGSDNKRKHSSGSQNDGLDEYAENSLLQSLSTAESASTFCAVNVSADGVCLSDSICFAVGLCTNQSIHTQEQERSPSIQHGLLVYKPALVALPLPPQSTHLLASLLGPSSKTTLLLKAFANSIYKFNNISMISSVATAIPTLKQKPSPVVSTFVVKRTTSESVLSITQHQHSESTATSKESLSRRLQQSKLASVKELETAENGELESPPPRPHQQQQQEEQHLPKSVMKKSEAQARKNQNNADLPKLNRSSSIATRLNVREILAESNRGSSSCLGLVIAMLCLICMGR